MVKPLSKAETRKALEELPDVSILGAQATKALTPKQRRFAREVAMGKTKAEAYRQAYKPNASPYTLRNEPYRVASDPRVSREIEALNLAEQAAAYRTPAKLREFVIQTLLEVALDPETKAAVRVQAVKTLGTVTEVAAFTERKEVRTISTSEAARAKVLEEIKSIMAGDDAVVDVQAKSLLDELQGGNVSTHDDTPEPSPDDTGSGYAEDGGLIKSTTYDGAVSSGCPEVSENPDSIPPKQGETLGGVSDAGVDGDPTVPHPPAV